MKARDIMTRELTTVTPEQSVLECSQILKEKGFKHLPVLERGRVVGVVTDRDLKRVSASDATTLEIHELLYLLDKLIVAKVMTRDVVHIAADASVNDAARMILERKVGCLPVLEGDALVGIITRDDLIALLAKA